MENYCRIQLIRKANKDIPDVVIEPNSPKFLGQDYKARCELKDKLQCLKELPMYMGLNHLEEILVFIKSLTDVYEDDTIKIFNSINPWDNAMDTNINWYSKTFTQKTNSLKKMFQKTLRKTFDHVILFPEFSEKGRFHFHGIIFMHDRRNLNTIRQELNKAYSNRPHSKTDTKAVKIDSYTESFYSNMEDNLDLNNKTRGIDYLTKDYNYMKCQGYPPIIITGSNQRVGKDPNLILKKIDFDFESLDKNIIQ